MAEPKLIDMAHTKAELKEEKREMAGYSKPPKYPWGLSISLGKAELDKLGIKALPRVGEELCLVAMVRVTSVSSNASEEQEENTSVSLQLVKMAIEPEKKGAEGAKGGSLMAYYGG